MTGISVRDPAYASYDEAGQRFTAVLEDCVERREPMIIPGGAYDFHTPLRVPSSFGVQILGTGWGAELNAAPGLNDYVIRFDSSAGDIRAARIADLTINGNATTQTTGGGILGNGAVNCWVERLHLFGCHTHALVLDKVEAGSRDFGRHNEVHGLLIDGGSASPGLGLGILILGSDENSLHDNRIQDCGGRDAYARGEETGGAIDCGGLTRWTGNDFVNGRDGLRVKDTNRVRVTGNNFDGPDGTALILTSTGSTVTGNEFLEGKAGRWYVDIRNGTGNTVSDNGLFTPDGPVMQGLIRETGNAAKNFVQFNKAHYRTRCAGPAFERRSPATGVWRDNLNI